MNGVNYVNWPRLIPLTDVIEYNGPGANMGKRGRGISPLNIGNKPPKPSSNSYRQKDELDYVLLLYNDNITFSGV
jgi:phosphatidylinositol 4-phosphatase